MKYKTTQKAVKGNFSKVFAVLVIAVYVICYDLKSHARTLVAYMGGMLIFTSLTGWLSLLVTAHSGEIYPPRLYESTKSKPARLVAIIRARMRRGARLSGLCWRNLSRSCKRCKALTGCPCWTFAGFDSPHGCKVLAMVSK